MSVVSHVRTRIVLLAAIAGSSLMVGACHRTEQPRKQGFTPHRREMLFGDIHFGKGAGRQGAAIRWMRTGSWTEIPVVTRHGFATAAFSVDPLGLRVLTLTEAGFAVTQGFADCEHHAFRSADTRIADRDDHQVDLTAKPAETPFQLNRQALDLICKAKPAQGSVSVRGAVTRLRDEQTAQDMRFRSMNVARNGPIADTPPVLGHGIPDEVAKGWKGPVVSASSDPSKMASIAAKASQRAKETGKPVFVQSLYPGMSGPTKAPAAPKSGWSNMQSGASAQPKPTWPQSQPAPTWPQSQDGN